MLPPKDKIFFYPDRPSKMSVIYKILKTLDVEISRNKNADYKFGIFWKNRTKTKLSWPVATTKFIINKYCQDISKKYVDEVHLSVFGYNTAIDPTVYSEKYVQKWNLNGIHLGKIKNKKSKPRSWYFYQKLINNTESDQVIDWRIPIFGCAVPFVYKKYRTLKKRFSNINSRVEIKEFTKVFSDDEIKLIFKFCLQMGLDYGEIDVLRDKDSKKIFIIDVNKTPWGPPNGLDNNSKKEAIKIMADYFKNNFLS